jgi:hypothetical protein
MSLMHVPEDLTQLSRADLVYKAKLAEQAERYATPECRVTPFPFIAVFSGRAGVAAV